VVLCSKKPQQLPIRASREHPTQVKLWNVKNKTTHETRENLSEEDLGDFLTSIAGPEIIHWEFCRSDLNNWADCCAIPAFRLRRFGLPAIPNSLQFTGAQLDWLELSLQNVLGKPKVAVPPPFTQSKIIPIKPASSNSHNSHNSPNWSERRLHPRKNLKLQVVLITDQNAFRTFTRNISMGGMALEKPVPQKLLGGECTIFLSEPGSTLKFSFTGVVLADDNASQAARHRIRFEQVAEKSRDALEKWIDAASRSGAALRSGKKIA